MNSRGSNAPSWPVAPSGSTSGKLAWPADLTFIYPRWGIAPDEPLAWLPLAGVAGLTGLLGWWRTRSRAPLAAWLLFTGTLFPVLGFFNVYPFIYSFVADHFPTSRVSGSSPPPPRGGLVRAPP